MRPWLVDAFAEEGYRGNPAGVIITPAGFPHERTMQAVARAVGLPTTAFVVPCGETSYLIRWFTPAKELNLCGHATIATAGYLWEVAGVDAVARLEFGTQNGTLWTSRVADGRIAVDLPRWGTVPCAVPAGLDEALGATVLHCERAVDDLLIELDSAATIAALEPDFAALARVHECRGHVVTARGPAGGPDFVSRSFFPSMGVDEDQVCVSAHCKLGPYWQARTGRSSLRAEQLSPRGGRLFLEMSGDRVRVAGSVQVRSALPAVAV